MRTLSLVALLAACSDGVVSEPIPPTPTLTVYIGRHNYEVEWPANSGDTVKTNNSLDHEAGLAGIEIAISGIVETGAILLDAEDLELYGKGPSFDVPEDGLIRVRSWLTQHGEVIAHGVAEWALEPKLKWSIEIERAPYPSGTIIPPSTDLDQPFVPCSPWRWCRGSYRLDRISEDAANYPGEALWLSVWGAYCPPGYVCY